MDAFASGEGERVTYRRRERDWLAVSGFKGNRIFYRKAILACGGKVWHHIEFEYPASQKQEMDAFVIRASRAIDQAENDNC
jgi:serine/threonine-protein kinase